MTNILAIVPARGGSKGLIGKNLAMCAGKPLIEWTGLALLDSKYELEIVVSTDSLEIANAFPNIGDTKFCDEISDDAQIEDRLDSIIRYSIYDSNIIVLLQPTSPIRTGKQIDEAIEQLQREGADSLVSVVQSHAFLWNKLDGFGLDNSYEYGERPRRQDLTQRYEENGSIYVFTREHWERTHNRLGGKISLYVMPEESRIQVDTPFDLWMAEQILEHQPVLVA